MDFLVELAQWETPDGQGIPHLVSVTTDLYIEMMKASQLA